MITALGKKPKRFRFHKIEAAGGEPMSDEVRSSLLIPISRKKD